MEESIHDLCRSITQPIFFVTPEIHWALGLEAYLPNYHIICLEDHPLIDLVSQQTKVFCLQKQSPELKVPKNTGHLLKNQLVVDYIAQQSQGNQPGVMYFKPLPQIDQICERAGYLQIGNQAKVARQFEDKIRLADLGKKDSELKLMPAEIKLLQEVKFSQLKTPAVIQFSRGWAGKSSFIIREAEDLQKLQAKFGNIKVKISPYLSGTTYLNNACVVNGQVLQSPPALQINRPHPEFSASPLATCGRSWPATGLHEEQLAEMQKVTNRVGETMHASGYQGYFGLDFLVEENSGEVYLLEINARLTASTSFYTQLEINSNATPLLFYHLLSWLPSHKNVILNLFQDPEEIRMRLNMQITGSQLILRNNQPQSVTIKKSLQPGIYELTKDDELKFIEQTYRISHVKRPEHFLLFSSAQGSQVSPESELLRCESPNPLTPNQMLKSGLLNALVSFKSQIIA